VKTSFLTALIAVLVGFSSGQTGDGQSDSSAIAMILQEGTANSRVMETLSYISDVYGPRLTGSPGFRRVCEWAMQQLHAIGCENVHVEGWTPLIKGWELKRYSANVIGKQVFPLLSYPRAWSPGTNGMVTGDVVYVDAGTDSALEQVRGKLKGKFVLLGEPREVKVPFAPLAVRETEASLLELANADVSRPRRRRIEQSPEARNRAQFESRRLQMLVKERPAALLSAGNYDGGSIMVMSAYAPTAHPDSPRTRVWLEGSPETITQVAVAVEHYNRMVRMLQKGERLKIEMNCEVVTSKPDSGYNVIAEIPGTDLKDELVMIGAHLDSWHGGTGATDNGTGVAVCMEAIRILKTLDLKPRRTIRIALWGGEEQGEYGSRAYVQRHFGERITDADGNQTVRLTPAGEKFSVYFNDDNGTGKFRGMYMEGNETVRPIFRKWFDEIGGERQFTLTLAGTGGTDHTQFRDIGLPGFQFIQDDIEYFNRTWHSTMDLYDRALEDDLKQGATIMAGFAYKAAMMNDRMPRIPAR
jgi:carboxypeptidase Q